MAQDERDYMIERTKRRYLAWLYDGKPPREPVQRHSQKLPDLPPADVPVLVWVFLAVGCALVLAFLIKLFR